MVLSSVYLFLNLCIVWEIWCISKNKSSMFFSPFIFFVSYCGYIWYSKIFLLRAKWGDLQKILERENNIKSLMRTWISNQIKWQYLTGTVKKSTTYMSACMHKNCLIFKLCVVVITDALLRRKNLIDMLRNL